MILDDQVECIVYRNEENGYSVVRLEGCGATAVGFMPVCVVGQGVQLVGEWVKNAKHGQQFSFSNCQMVIPNQAKKIKQFLGSGLISGVGPITAGNIVKEFGDDTLKIIEQEHHRLATVKGVTQKKAQRIYDEFTKIKDMQQSVMFLQKFDISLNLAIKIYEQYRQKTIEIVSRNPYCLIETVDGVGFLTADKIAADLGVQYNGNFRVRAGVVYCLKLASERDGHTYLERDNLNLEVCKLLKIKMEKLIPVLDDVLESLQLDNYVAVVEPNRVALVKFYKAEKSIAQKLCLINSEVQNQDTVIDGVIEHYQQINKIKLHGKQLDAVKMAINSGVCVITGGPGTGKTTIIKAIISILKNDGKSFKLLAPTGRAAKRMEEATAMPAATIHRGLGLALGGNKFFAGDDKSTVKEDVVIVDEISMCDCLLMQTLLNNISRTTKLIMVGDSDQLPSVGAGNILADILASGVIPNIRLTEIYRQSALSQIVLNAHAINNGQMPLLDNKADDFFFESCESPTQIKEKVVSLVSDRLPKYLKLKSENNIQVLCPLKLGEAGVISLNEELQKVLNPSVIGKNEVAYGKTVFRVGDRVMQTVNNYDMEWDKQLTGGGVESGSGVFNGDIGVVVDINKGSGEISVVLDDGRMAVYTRSDLANLVLSYAITIHKSQGCEFDTAVIPVTSGAYMVLTRNLLYTAITRAKKLVVLVGSRENIAKMVNNTFTKRRFSSLKDLLKTESVRYKDIFS
ncbi:MAG: ATP-dependent RecD-like DNA helicase [Firmicutes bacterium]|nr:ATP-dependent RecD-like DNA helicase [Bacillota bacterium]